MLAQVFHREPFSAGLVPEGHYFFDHVASVKLDETNSVGGLWDTDTLLSHAYRLTQNVQGSWSRGRFVDDAPNDDYSDKVLRIKPNRTVNGVTYGHRSTSMGDRILLSEILHGEELWEVAPIGWNKVERSPPEAFCDWSPAQLAHALGVVIDLRSFGSGGQRQAWFVGQGIDRALGHDEACQVLSRMASQRGIDASKPPTDCPRALVNGQQVHQPA